jgi:DNA polymerase delta subunit 3
MANDYSEYLSANVLNDGQTVSRAALVVCDGFLTPAEQVSYRTLSRALRVHNNLAKQMLYDFHRSQNNKLPKSLHATYLVTGTQSLPPQQAENDTLESQDASDKTLQTSPAHQTPGAYQATSLLLVDEDNLDSQSAWSSSDCKHILLTSMQPPSLLSTTSCQYTSTAFSLARSMYHQFSYFFQQNQLLTPRRICMS